MSALANNSITIALKHTAHMLGSISQILESEYGISVICSISNAKPNLSFGLYLFGRFSLFDINIHEWDCGVNIIFMWYVGRVYIPFLITVLREKIYLDPRLIDI
jgi:hypothetical protein